MRILGLDTATRATVAAVCEIGKDGDWLEAECRDDPPPGARPGHSAQLLELAFAALRRSGSSWAEIDRIAVGIGPGTFTGMRIGIATARALAAARDIPLVGVSTLQSLAVRAVPAAAERGAELVAGVIDARRGELFAAAWALDAAGVPTASHDPALPARAYAPDDLVAAIRATGVRTLTVGDGAIPFRRLLERCGALVPSDDSTIHRVSAIGHCRLGAATAPDDASPSYLRLPDAEISRRRTAP